MTSSELHSLLNASPAPLLLHVLPEEVFAAQRIPGSCNACVYEMAFLDQVAALIAGKDQPVIVYGAGADSNDAATALVKLTAAGYTNVTAFGGGLAAWRGDGLPVESDGPLPSSPALSGSFRVDTAQSVIRWTGRNLFNHHHGTVKLAGGTIELNDSQLVSACFSVAMDSIACEDLVDSTWNEMLLRHLRSDDFFDVAQYPTAAFVAVSIEPLPACTDGTPNYLLRGRFTLRGITQPIEFPVLVASADGQRLTAQGVLDLDRTHFGSIYGSGKFFLFLGKHIVNDVIHLHVKLHADKQP